jgi:hypothetical protein
MAYEFDFRRGWALSGVVGYGEVWSGEVRKGKVTIL